MEMEDNNTELEEGEASCYYDDDEENVNPDNDLSHFDERIQHALGHFRKDFDGGMVSSEYLGAKYGGYGSFLPSHERSPSVWSDPKTPQKNYNASRSPKCLTEGATQNLKASSNAPQSARLGTANIAHLPHNSHVLPGDISVKKDSCLPSTQVAERCSLKDRNPNRPGNLTDQRTLKVRIKMNTDNAARKNVAIYSGLGLNSPSSSLEDSPEASGEMPAPSQVTVDESPTNIVQVMTSFHVPGDALISPLHENLLCLVRKRVLPQQKVVPSSKGHQVHHSLSVEELVTTWGNEKVSNGMKIKVAGKDESRVKLKLENGIKNNTRILMKIKSETDTVEDKNLVPNDLKVTPLSNSGFGVGDYLKVIGRKSEASRQANESEMQGRSSSSELVKEESLESISGQGCVKIEKQKSRYGSVEKVWEQKDVPVDLMDNGKSKGYKISASRDDSDVSKCKEDPDMHRQNAVKKGTSQEQEKTNVPGKREKPTVEGRIKSKANQSNEKLPTVSTKESLGLEMGIVPKDNLSGGHGVPPSSRKTPKLKSQKENVRDKQRDSLGSKTLEQRDRMDLAERPADDIEVKGKACLDKPKENLSGKKIVHPLLSKDTPQSSQPTMENGLASGITPTASAPIVIEENWVGCDSCQKWRLLPFGTRPEQLPDKWLCSMLNWLPGMNRCYITEEETTKAVNALYQPPSSESLNKPQAHANVTGSAVPAVDVLHIDQNYQNLSSPAMPYQGKKKNGIKEIPNAGGGSGPLNSTRNHLQEAVKSVSSNDINQPPVESNPMKKSSSQQMRKLQNLEMEKSIPKKKEKHMTGGDANKIRLKNKNEADQHTFGTSKKAKREEMWHADKNQNSDIDVGKVGVSSSTGLLTQERVQEVKYNDLCYSGGTKDAAKDKLQVSAKKLLDQTLDVNTCSKMDSSMKKRKMRDWQDTQNNVETFQNFVHEEKAHTKEESSESGYRKEKKLRILKADGKEFSTSNGDDKSNRKSNVTQIVLSGTKVNSIDAMGNDRSIAKDQKPRKHSKKNSSDQTLDGVNSFRRDLESGHVSLAATSSSSKVSGSHKTRVNLEEVKGSPVESVSSSPLRTSNSDRLNSAKGDASGKGDAVYGGFPSTNGSKRCWDGDGNIDRFGTMRKENNPRLSHPEPHKFSSVSHQDRDGITNGEFTVKAKASSVVWNTHFLSGSNDSLGQHGQCLSGQHGMGHCYDDDRENKNLPEPAVCVQKCGKGSYFQSKGNVRSGTSDVGRTNLKFSNPVNDNLKKSQRSEIEPNHRPVVNEKGNNVTNNLFKKGSTNSVEVKADHHVSRGDNVVHGSRDSVLHTQLKRKDYDVSDVKFSATQNPNRKGGLQHNLIQSNEGSQMQIESRNGKSQLFSHCQGERKEETPSLCSQPVAMTDREVVFQGLPVDSTVNGDMPKTLKQSGTGANKNGANCNLVHLMPDQQRAIDVNAPRISVSQTATNTLKEAKRLRDYADHLKNSGFDFESSEAYFQAALKFLHGASLLERCSGENGKHADMTQLQVYSTTAKLCELCAHEYERRKEVASAALAYKCMEVTYMKVVYYKSSSTNRVRHELQASLNMAPQGESPSSSASDIDNLNNQVLVEKAILSKGTGSHVSGNHVVIARNRSNFVRLLDFTQDVAFAMEGSRKTQNAFTAACATLEDAHKNDCISSIRRVVDFSFQDLEELIRLVKLAMEAIGRSKLGGARD